MSLRGATVNSSAYLRPLALFAGTVIVTLSLTRLGLVLWQLDRVMAADMLGTAIRRHSGLHA